VKDSNFHIVLYADDIKINFHVSVKSHNFTKSIIFLLALCVFHYTLRHAATTKSLMSVPVCAVKCFHMHEFSFHIH